MISIADQHHPGEAIIPEHFSAGRDAKLAGRSGHGLRVTVDSPRVQWAYDTPAPSIQHMRIDHRSGHVRVAEQFLPR